MKVKCSVVSATPIDWAEQANQLIEQVSSFAALPGRSDPTLGNADFFV